LSDDRGKPTLWSNVFGSEPATEQVPTLEVQIPPTGEPTGKELAVVRPEAGEPGRDDSGADSVGAPSLPAWSGQGVEEGHAQVARPLTRASRNEFIIKTFREQQEHNSLKTIAAVVRDAQEIDDDTEKPPEGWTPRRFRRAKDGRKSTAHAPFYLKMVMEMYAASRSQPVTNVHADTITFYLPKQESDEEASQKPVIDVTPITKAPK
jgi:hypothetical protein